MMSLQAEAAVGVSFRRTTEKVLAVTTLILGLGLTAFTMSFRLDAYAFLELIASSSVWSVYLTSLGAVRLSFLIVNGYYPRSPAVRASMSFLTLLTVWSPISAAFVFSTFVDTSTNSSVAQFYPGAALAPGFIVIEGLCLYALLVLWKVKRDGRRSSEDHRSGSDDRGIDLGSIDSGVAGVGDLEEARIARRAAFA